MINSKHKTMSLILLGFLISFSLGQNRATKDYRTFKDLSGREVSLNDFKGQITLLNFCATWSAGSLREMPALQKISNDFAGEKVQVLGVVVMSDTSKIEQLKRVTHISYPLLIGTRQHLQNISQSLIIPQTIVLDKQGRILKRFEGTQSYKTFSEFLENYLNQAELTSHNGSSAELSRE